MTACKKKYNHLTLSLDRSAQTSLTRPNKNHKPHQTKQKSPKSICSFHSFPDVCKKSTPSL